MHEYAIQRRVAGNVHRVGCGGRIKHGQDPLSGGSIWVYQSTETEWPLLYHPRNRVQRIYFHEQQVSVCP